MTEENQKKLYEHYVRTEQRERAQEVLKVYPHFDPVWVKAQEKLKKEEEARVKKEAKEAANSGGQ